MLLLVRVKNNLFIVSKKKTSTFSPRMGKLKSGSNNPLVVGTFYSENY